MPWLFKASKTKSPPPRTVAMQPEQYSTVKAVTKSDKKSPEQLEAYKEGVSHAIQSVINEIDLQANKRIENGFSELGFTFGVLNCFLVLIIFGVYPQHFWILYLIEAAIFFPVKTLELIRSEPNSILYFLDLCWVMNFCGIISLIVLMFGNNRLADYFYQNLFLASFGIACGPLLGATGLLPFVSLVFHENKSMTSVFIHIFPPLLFYIFRWDSDLVEEAWPNTFHLDYEIPFFSNEGSFTHTVFGNSIIAYAIWFVPYIVWQLLVGLELPKSGRYDTVYHANMRTGLCVFIGNVLWKRPKETSLEYVKSNDFELRDFGAYIGFHVIGFICSLLILAYPCSLSQHVHASFLIICTVIVTWRGAKRYTYYSTKMYSRLIRKEFKAELDYGKENGKSDVEHVTPVLSEETKDNYYQLQDREDGKNNPF